MRIGLFVEGSSSSITTKTSVDEPPTIIRNINKISACAHRSIYRRRLLWHFLFWLSSDERQHFWFVPDSKRNYRSRKHPQIPSSAAVWLPQLLAPLLCSFSSLAHCNGHVEVAQLPKIMLLQKYKDKLYLYSLLSRSSVHYVFWEIIPFHSVKFMINYSFIGIEIFHRIKIFSWKL